MSNPQLPADSVPPLAPEPAPVKTKRRKWPLAVGGAVTLAAVGYGAAVFYVSGDVPAGTTVRGVNIGGLSTDAAVSKLSDELSAQAKKAVEVTANGKDMQIKPAKAGMSVDWTATVEQASGTVLAPADLFEHLTGTVTLDPITKVDETKLTAALDGLAEVADTSPVEPEIVYKAAKAKLTPGKDGQEIAVTESVQQVSEAFFAEAPGTVKLAMTAVRPKVSNETAKKVLSEFAEPAVSGDVTLLIADEDDATIEPADIAENLTFSVSKNTLAPSLDGKGLHKSLAKQLQGVERPGRDARIIIESDKPVIVPSRNGVAIDNDELAEAVLKVLPETDSSKRTATVQVSSAKAKFTTAEAKALKIGEKLSTFLQAYPPAEYRYINVGTAARKINGTLLMPGDTFSMNGTLGERTEANGYTKGFIISGGVFKEELGGGVSIITTATWTAAFYAGLERIESHPHGLYISRYQAGLEATVSWGYLDLRFRNDTKYGVLITATRYNDGVRITMWGNKTFDKVTSTFTDRHSVTDYQTIYDDSDTCVPSDGVRGFQIAVTRRIVRDGQAVKTETWPTTYKPTPHVICSAKPTG
ncbi:MAG: VanW family protein [Candidatus Nanopelagicales bacterium]